jgi:cobalt-zinc-cadmium efflux system protein
MHGHDHQHARGHHAHQPGPGGEAPRNRAFAIGVALNLLFVGIEVTVGLIGGSLALLADAAHNLGDVGSLLLAWGASLIAGSRPTERRTYGLRRATILAALASTLLLLVGLGAIAWEAVRRLGEPAPVVPLAIIVVAFAGVVVNGVTALLFVRGSDRDLNLRAAFLHMAADAGVSLAVVLGGVAIAITGALWVDPMLSLAVVLVVLVSTWSLGRESWNLAVDAVPRSIDPGSVRSFLLSRPGVEGVHDLHIWGLSTTQCALTAHLVVPDGFASDDFLHRISRELEKTFGIGHATIQIERGDAEHPCGALEDCR